ncbi:MAG: hypothetical protein HN509_15000 [Halobacteriovoraceae bacterium]|jgi:hypothetical protein|nr:hypothetical protein [Halobacteriovoraceae bacterium]MBT5093371.1 hypothetical protein [Halobacteriovoraceae bacterium]
MKTLLATAVMIFSFNANALFLNSCYNTTFGDEAVSYSYESCLNRNFREIEREVDEIMFLNRCSNFPRNMVSYSFTSCLTRNFREIERKLGNSIFLNRCTSFRTDTLDFSFTSCVNRNFRTIERELR